MKCLQQTDFDISGWSWKTLATWSILAVANHFGSLLATGTVSGSGACSTEVTWHRLGRCHRDRCWAAVLPEMHTGIMEHSVRVKCHELVWRQPPSSIWLLYLLPCPLTSRLLPTLSIGNSHYHTFFSYPFRNRFCMASCSYLHIFILYIYRSDSTARRKGWCLNLSIGVCVFSSLFLLSYNNYPLFVIYIYIYI